MMTCYNDVVNVILITQERENVSHNPAICQEGWNPPLDDPTTVHRGAYRGTLASRRGSDDRRVRFSGARICSQGPRLLARLSPIAARTATREEDVSDTVT